MSAVGDVALAPTRHDLGGVREGVFVLGDCDVELEAYRVAGRRLMAALLRRDGWLRRRVLAGPGNGGGMLGRAEGWRRGIVMLLAGRAAVQAVYGMIFLADEAHIEQARVRALMVVERQCPVVADPATAARLLIEECSALALVALTAHRRELDELARAIIAGHRPPTAASQPRAIDPSTQAVDERAGTDWDADPDAVPASVASAPPTAQGVMPPAVFAPRQRLQRGAAPARRGRGRRQRARRIAYGWGSRLTETSIGTDGLALLRPGVPRAGARVRTAVGLRSFDTHDVREHESVGVMTRLQRLRWFALALVWAAVTTSFWTWWLRYASQSPPGLYWLETVTLFYQTSLLPTFYWFFVGKMRRPVELTPPADLRVAMISLCVPSEESIDIVRGQLEALRAVRHPHDSWILDEGASAEIRALAESLGVRYFTRRGVEGWNEPEPPFQRATKAGNVNAWLDYIGLDYDVFVQLDIDHRPRADYLDRVLGYFRASRIGWVQAPSVCSNLQDWTARGLAEQDLVFQGPLQMGFYGHSGTPFIIGSHTSYRTSAIRTIGGFQPTRAEDHLDTVVMAAHGYEGVFVPDLIAAGNGPHDLATYLRQQFAWAYSMFQIFVGHMPGLVRRYSAGQTFQFLMAQSWYALWSLSMAILWALPSVALVIHRPISNASLGDFLLYFIPLILTSSLMWCESRKWFQPSTVKLSWRGVMLDTIRWPVVLWALLNVIFKVKRAYMITPKGDAARETATRVSIYALYLALAAVPLAAIWIFWATAAGGTVGGYCGLALANATGGVLIVTVILIMDIKQTAAITGPRAALRMRAGVGAAVVAMQALLVLSAVTVWVPMMQVLR